MEHENTRSGVLQSHNLPEGTRWMDFSKKSGINLLNDYKRIFLTLWSENRVSEKAGNSTPNDAPIDRAQMMQHWADLLAAWKSGAK